MGTTIHEPKTRAELEKWLKPSPPPANTPLVMILNGSSSQVQSFSKCAMNAAQKFEFRELVWIKDPSLLTADDQSRLFKGDSQNLAVVLSTRCQPVVWITASNANDLGAEKAYLAAGKAVGGS